MSQTPVIKSEEATEQLERIKATRTRWGKLLEELQVSNFELTTILLDNFKLEKKTTFTQTESYIYTRDAVVQTDIILDSNHIITVDTANGIHTVNFKNVNRTLKSTNAQINTANADVQTVNSTKTYSDRRGGPCKGTQLRNLSDDGVRPSVSFAEMNSARVVDWSTHRPPSKNSYKHVTTVNTRVPSIDGAIAVQRLELNKFFSVLNRSLASQVIPSNCSSSEDVGILSDYLLDFGTFVRINFAQINKAIFVKIRAMLRDYGKSTELFEILNLLISNWKYQPTSEKAKVLATFEICREIESKGLPLPDNSLENNRKLRKAYEKLLLSIWTTRLIESKVQMLMSDVLDRLIISILRIFSHTINFHIKVLKSFDGELKFVIGKWLLGKDSDEPPLKVIKTEHVSSEEPEEPDSILPDF